MSETKKRKRKNAAPAAPAPHEIKLVVTLRLPKGDVVKVEKLAKSGERQQVSDKELAAITGADEMEYLGAALEDTYAAGMTDAIDGELGEDDAFDDDDDEIDRIILRETVGRQFARRGVRTLILRKALRRKAGRKRAHPARKGSHEGASGEQSPT